MTSGWRFIAVSWALRSYTPSWALRSYTPESSVTHEVPYAPPDLESCGIAAQNRDGACARLGTGG